MPSGSVETGKADKKIMTLLLIIVVAIMGAAKQAYRWDNAGWTLGKVVLVCAVVIAAILAWASGLHT